MKALAKAGLLTALSVAALAGGHFVFFCFVPLDRAAAPAAVVIEPGHSLRQIARQLAERKILRNAFEFRLLGRIAGGGRKLQSGEYELSAAMRPLDILCALGEGRVLRHRFTIPEGYTLAQIAAAMQAAGLAEAGDFLRQARDPQWLKTLGVPGKSLEGFLFPETYSFPRFLSPQRLQKEMVDCFFLNYPPLLRQRAAQLRMTLLQVVTLASIIEKESGKADDQPLISAVFHNRLRKKMRLQADPTVIYGLDPFSGNLTKRDLQTPTPYNTYVIFGLPPGPIANPGLRALRAALWPADSKALYFVARGDGTHVFTETLIDHNQQVEKFQKKSPLARRSAMPPAAPPPPAAVKRSKVTSPPAVKPVAPRPRPSVAKPAAPPRSSAPAAGDGLPIVQ